MPTPSRDAIYRAVIRRMVAQALEDQERAFEETHRDDTDQQLLCFLRQQAQILMRSPRYKEIPGWRLCEQRFGSWNAALLAAGLRPVSQYPVTKLPRYVEEEIRQKALYSQKKAERRASSPKPPKKKKKRKKSDRL